MYIFLVSGVLGQIKRKLIKGKVIYDDGASIISYA